MSHSTHCRTPFLCASASLRQIRQNRRLLPGTFHVVGRLEFVRCKNKIISTTYTIIFRIRFPVYRIIYQYGTRAQCVLSIALSFLLNSPVLLVPMERILQHCSAAFLLPVSSFRRCQFCMQNYGTFSRIHYSIITQFLVNVGWMRISSGFLRILGQWLCRSYHVV